MNVSQLYVQSNVAIPESFTYDSQDRLLTFNDNNGNRSHAYDARGRITTNSAVGTYAYAGAGYQQTELTLNTAGQTYFNNYTTQDITYNAFMGRATMFYGGTQTDKLQRRYRRHYSHDGSMEITQDTQTGKLTFVTYMGGDAYSAPAIWHSEQTSTTVEQYYYLHRDYLGSILGITYKNGVFKEKRHFDAWEARA